MLAECMFEWLPVNNVVSSMQLLCQPSCYFSVTPDARLVWREAFVVPSDRQDFCLCFVALLVLGLSASYVCLRYRNEVPSSPCNTVGVAIIKTCILHISSKALAYTPCLQGGPCHTLWETAPFELCGRAKTHSHAFMIVCVPDTATPLY